MGDRAIIILTDGTNISPTIYLHWNGSDVPALLQALKARMTGRENDLSYATARLIGLAHDMIPGNLSLGVSETTSAMIMAILSRDPALLNRCSPGDAGLVVVDLLTFAWQAYDGYLADDAMMAAE